MSNINLTQWSKLNAWTQKYYRRSMRSNLTKNEDGTWTCIVDFSAWEVGKGTGYSKDEAKAAAAADAWRKIESGAFIGDSLDEYIFDSWKHGKDHSPVEGLIKNINRDAATPDDEE